MADRRRQRGSCHCGAVRFSFWSEPLGTGLRCNCSLCARRGTVMSASYLPPEDFEELKGLEALTLYRWGDHLVNHWFCGTCGISLFHDAVARPGHYRINLGCVEGLDPLALAVEVVDGRSF